MVVSDDNDPGVNFINNLRPAFSSEARRFRANDKKAILQNFFVRNSIKSLLNAKKSFEEFAGDFSVFAKV